MPNTHITHKACCLLDMPGGAKLQVDELKGNPAHLSRLHSLGILPGTELEVRDAACGSGSVCIRVRQSSLILGADMAGCILCFPAGDPRCRHRHGHGHGHGHDAGHERMHKHGHKHGHS